MQQVRFSDLQKHKSERIISSTFGSWKGILLQYVGELSALESRRDVKLKVRIIWKSVLTFQRITCLDSETMEYSDIHLGLSRGRLWAQLRRRLPFYRKFFLRNKAPLSFYVKINVCSVGVKQFGFNWSDLKKLLQAIFQWNTLSRFDFTPSAML